MPFVVVADLFRADATKLFARRHGVWVAIVGMAAYTLLTGAGDLGSRAAITGSLAVLRVHPG